MPAPRLTAEVQTVNAETAVDMGLQTFRYFGSTHVLAYPGDAPDTGNAALVTVELADGTSLAIWANGTLQATAYDSDVSTNYLLAPDDAGNVVIERHEVQPR